MLRGRAGDGGAGEDAEFGDEDGYQPALLQKPYTRGGGWQEKEAPQKWVQCANCSLWRKARIRASVNAVALVSICFQRSGGAAVHPDLLLPFSISRNRNPHLADRLRMCLRRSLSRCGMRTSRMTGAARTTSGIRRMRHAPSRKS